MYYLAMHPLLLRLMQAVFVAFLLMLIAFVLIRVIPGDPVAPPR